MIRYVLDSNIYITANRDREFGGELARFVGDFLPQIYLHAVVIQELVRGAVAAAGRRRLEKEIIDPFLKRGRIVVPGVGAWKRSGEVVAELVERGSMSRAGIPASFMNDVLLATSCRDAGLTLITRNASDFARISLVERVSFCAPWPSA